MTSKGRYYFTEIDIMNPRHIESRSLTLVISRITYFNDVLDKADIEIYEV